MDSDRHPHFPSALAWHRELGPALAAASTDGRRVLVVHGPRTCAGTRTFVERTLAKEEIAEFAGQHFVLVVSDPDEPRAELRELFTTQGLPWQGPTPVCVYLDGAKVIHHTAGGRPPAVLLNDLLNARARR